jgi:hypothetical protein
MGPLVLRQNIIRKPIGTPTRLDNRRRRLSRFATFDDLADGFAAMFLQITNIHAKVLGRADHPDMELIVGGWSSERDCAELYIIHNHDKSGLSAWTLTPVLSGYVSPCDEALIGRLRSDGIDIASDDFDASTDGLRVMQSQRDRKWDYGHGTIMAVGGFCQLTTLTRNAITTKILHRWSDAIGERISHA